MKKQYFKVGDKVTCPIFGKGVVVNIQPRHDQDVFPVKVEFEEDEEKIEYDYTFDGRSSIYGKPILHKGHIDIPEPELKEIVSFEKGEIVWGMDKYGEWYCVRFAEFETYITSNMFSGYHPQKTDDVYNWETFHDIKKYEDGPF